MPLRGDAGGFQNGNRERFEVVVQGLGQAEWVPILREIAMGDLPDRMHACIGAPCGGNGMRAGFKFGQRSFDCPLHRGLVGLALPACEGGAVIFDKKGIAGHRRCLAGSAEARKGGKAGAGPSLSQVPCLCCVQYASGVRLWDFRIWPLG